MRVKGEPGAMIDRRGGRERRGRRRARQGGKGGAARGEEGISKFLTPAAQW